MIYVVLYLGAVILANLIVARYGPASTIPVGFLFIGLDLTARDHLHDAWHGEGLAWKMAVLIATGSLFTWLINRNAGPIAVASFVAFASAATVDALVYHYLRRYPRWLRINGSNVPSAAVDSIVFQIVAFGGFPWVTILGQFLAKTLGGFLWSLLFRRLDRAALVGAE